MEKFYRLFVLILGGVLCVWALDKITAQTRPAASSSPAAAPFHPQKLAEMDRAIEEAVAANDCPGAVLWLERGGAAYHKAYGKRALIPVEERQRTSKIFATTAR